MTKIKVKLNYITEEQWFSLHEAAEHLGIASRDLLEKMKELNLIRFTLFGTFTVLNDNQVKKIKQSITKGDHNDNSSKHQTL